MKQRYTSNFKIGSVEIIHSEKQKIKKYKKEIDRASKTNGTPSSISICE